MCFRVCGIGLCIVSSAGFFLLCLLFAGRLRVCCLLVGFVVYLLWFILWFVINGWLFADLCVLTWVFTFVVMVVGLVAS